MQGRPTTTRHPERASAAAHWIAALFALAFALFIGAVPSQASTTRLKLPAERTSSTGNFFTLEAYDPPTSSNPVANFDMKVCASAHTPRDTAIDPEFFTLRLGRGVVSESVTSAKSPPLGFQPLAPLHCAQGWLGFRVPKGESVASLVYTYKGSISWAVG